MEKTIIFFMLGFVALGQAQDIEYPVNSEGQCQIPGICTGGIFDDITSDILDQNECLFACQDRDTCEAWTYYPTQKECWTFQEPCSINLDEAQCADCTSGDRDCQPLYVCRVEGECSGGTILASVTTASGDECLTECQANAECHWYTWDSSNDRCLLFDQCDPNNLNECSTCESGETLCSVSEQELDYGKILLTGGRTDTSYYTEILDVEGRFSSCDTPARVYAGEPIQLYAQAGGFLSDRAIACGGYNYQGGDTVKDCWEFRMNDDNDGSSNDGDDGLGKWTESSFKLATQRAETGYVKMDDNRLWITGGYSTSGEVTSTEILTHTESSFSFSSGEALPRAASGHCLVKVNNSADGQEYVMLGGYPYSNEVHYINLNDPNPEWTNLANMLDSKKGAYCGYVEDDDGTNRRIVVAAGLAGSSSRLTFTYHFDTDSWDDAGPEYPDATSSYGYSVHYKNTFLTGDGEQSDGTIYKYDVTTDDWDEVITGTTEHYFGTGMLIPDAFYCHCGDEVEETNGDQTTCTSASQGTRFRTSQFTAKKDQRTSFLDVLRNLRSGRLMW